MREILMEFSSYEFDGHIYVHTMKWSLSFRKMHRKMLQNDTQDAWPWQLKKASKAHDQHIFTQYTCIWTVIWFVFVDVMWK